MLIASLAGAMQECYTFFPDKRAVQGSGKECSAKKLVRSDLVSFTVSNGAPHLLIHLSCISKVSSPRPSPSTFSAGAVEYYQG